MVGKRDQNEPAVIHELEARGVTVRKIAQKDLPDLRCDYKGILFEVEVKMPGKKLRDGQEKYFAAARERGVPVFVVEEPGEIQVLLFTVENWY